MTRFERIILSAAMASMATFASAYHCSNDAPTPISMAPPEKMEAMRLMPVHMLEDYSSDHHSPHQQPKGEEEEDTTTTTTTHSHSSDHHSPPHHHQQPKGEEEEDTTSHSHSHNHGMPAPGYNTANEAMGRALRGVTKQHLLTPPSFSVTPLQLSSITLLPNGRAYDLQNLTLTWLQSFDPDRFLAGFRQVANISMNNKLCYGGWEDCGATVADGCLLRGHIAGGHFLSGASLMVASTRDPALNATVYYMIGELLTIQEANANVAPVPGYLSAFPVDHFDRLESNTEPIWAPYYTIHKILAGLHDVYTLVGDKRTSTIASGMLSYFAARIRNVIAQGTIAAWYAVMNIEFGGMNEVALDWYAITGQADALYVAQMFNKPCILGPLSLGADILSDEHANTHLPIVKGAAVEYEQTGDLRYHDAVQTLFDAVSGSHTFATGGSSSGEWWGEPHRLGDQLDINGVESCSTYNILKISSQLFTWTLNATFMEFNERAKFSGMYGTTHPNIPGRVIYLLPLRGPNGMAGGSKAHSYWGYSDPTESMWCCVGSNLESNSKLGDTLFFQEVGSSTLLLTLYENAQVAWPVPGDANNAVATVAQVNTWAAEGGPASSPSSLTTTVSVSLSSSSSSGSSSTFSIALRVPAWAINPTASVNGGASVPAVDGWFNITRTWAASGDVITATFPFAVILEPLNDDRVEYADYFALIAGPFALGAITHTENVIIGANSTLTPPTWVRPVTAAERAAAVSFGAVNASSAFTFMRHDNVTSVWYSVLDFGSGGNGNKKPATYTLQPQGFLSEGDDLYNAVMLLSEAEALCSNMSTCVGITFEGSDPNPTTPIDMYLKSAVNYVASTGWQTYVSSRAGNDLGGDEDGPDSTWIQSPPLSTTTTTTISTSATTASFRSMNRPGEYLVCPTVNTQCSIAHDDGSNTPAFQASATYTLVTPGLTGAPNTVSLQSFVDPTAYVSWYSATPPPANSTANIPISAQKNIPGNSAFAQASTFALSEGNWLPPTLAYVASTSSPNTANSRDLLVYPVADIVSEWYGVYLQVHQ